MSDIRADIEAVAAECEGEVEAVDDLRGDIAFRAAPGAFKGFLARLKERGFTYLSFITAVDNYLDEPRFEVTYRLRSIEKNADVRVNVPVGGEKPVLASVTDLFRSADWLEREVWDMFGVRFDGHPNLVRILMWEGFDGHPLRKDYPLLGNSPGTPGYVGKGGKA